MIPDAQAPHGVGASHSTTPNLDSRLALQVDAKLTDDFSAVVQGVTEYAVYSTYKPKLSLAHVKYRFSRHFTARLGRINAPLYMLSEFQRVGYAMPWVRAPFEVYNTLLPFDGAEGLYTFNLGETAIGVQGFYGRSHSEIVDIDNFRGLAVTADHGFSSFRAVYIQGKLQPKAPEVGGLFDLYAQVAPGVADRLDPRGSSGKFEAVGYVYDPGTWFLRSEVVRSDNPSMQGRTDSGYLTVGIRRGKLTPSLTFAHVDYKVNYLGAADPIGIVDLAAAAGESSRHSFTAGLRWDVRESMDIKFQATHVQNHAGSYGALSNIQPGFQTGGSYNLLSASFDFVF